MARKDLLSRLADAGEEAIAKLAESPGGDRLMGTMNSFRDRIDELQRRVRGIDALERRVTELERRLGVEPSAEDTEAGADAAADAEPPDAAAPTEGPPEDVFPPAGSEARGAEGVGDVSEPVTTSPTPPPTPPPPVAGETSEPFGDVPGLPEDRPFPPAETTETIGTDEPEPPAPSAPPGAPDRF